MHGPQGLLALEACPVCRRPLPDPSDSRFPFGATELRRCAGCDAVTAVAALPPEVLYGEGYLEGGNGHGPPDVTEPRFARFLATVAMRRVDAIEASGARPPGRLLDIGCGHGELLAAARLRGWTVLGLDPVEGSAVAAAERFGLHDEILTTTLEDADLADGSFDVVTFVHVMEHLPNIPDVLARARRLLAPGGRLMIEVPNWGSVQRRLAADGWIGLMAGEHLTQFTPGVLRSALVRAGFADDAVSVATPSWVWPETRPAEAMQQLGLRRWAGKPWVRHLGLPADDRRPQRLRRPVGLALDGTLAALDRAGRGALCLAIARVP